MSDNSEAGTQQETGEQQEQGKALSQADVDRIVKDRLAQQAKRYADYDELKAKAEGAKTIEQKFAELEQKYTAAEARALRSSVAAQFGISTKKGPNGEPSDADLFLTGSDEATLTAQAERLAQREADRKKNGNVARKEGGTTTAADGKAGLREIARSVFGSANN